jgi:hypothetical protein
MEDEFILLINGSRESEEALKILEENEVSFKPILTDGDGGHSPSLLTSENNYEGLNGIKYFVDSRKNNKKEKRK